MSLVIIKSNPEYKSLLQKNTSEILHVAEFFCDTIQGENFVGYPAAFLRLQGCTQSCAFCDSKKVWESGNPYSFSELFSLMDRADLPRKLHDGQHLVLTGGSPLKQQDQLGAFISRFIDLYSFKPYIEIENECTRFPNDFMCQFVDCWNNSPKLANSGNAKELRYRPNILQFLSKLRNSWFKFVVSTEDQWNEIDLWYIKPGFIRKSQVVLMPLGGTREELVANRETVIDMAIKYGVRYSTREHIVVWDKKTGI